MRRLVVLLTAVLRLTACSGSGTGTPTAPPWRGRGAVQRRWRHLRWALAAPGAFRLGDEGHARRAVHLAWHRRPAAPHGAGIHGRAGRRRPGVLASLRHRRRPVGHWDRLDVPCRPGTSRRAPGGATPTPLIQVASHRTGTVRRAGRRVTRYRPSPVATLGARTLSRPSPGALGSLLPPGDDLAVHLGRIADLEVVQPVPRRRVDGLLEPRRTVVAAERDREDDAGGGSGKVLARQPQVGEAAPATESDLALGCADRRRAQRFERRSHDLARRLCRRVAGQGVLGPCIYEHIDAARGLPLASPDDGS